MTAKEYVLKTVPPYSLMKELEDRKLGYWYDGTHCGWEWNAENVEKEDDNYLWKVVAISNTEWLGLYEYICKKYERKYPDFEWYREN